MLHIVTWIHIVLVCGYVLLICRSSTVYCLVATVYLSDTGMDPMLGKESIFPKDVQFEDKSTDLRRGYGANKARLGYHSAKTEDQKGFYPIL